MGGPRSLALHSLACVTPGTPSMMLVPRCRMPCLEDGAEGTIPAAGVNMPSALRQAWVCMGAACQAGAQQVPLHAYQ